MLNCYSTGHKHSATVCQAFAAGIVGAPILPPAPYVSGQTFMYGCLRGLLPTLRQAQAKTDIYPWFYGDNGYVKRGHYHGYYRVTRNAYQHDGRGEADEGRWRSLGLDIKPWRKGGKHIVVCPPSRLWGALMGFSADVWLDQTLKKLGEHTDRPIRVRMKMSWEQVKKPTAPLEEDLADAWMLVTHSSNAAVEAVLYGVPVICTESCAAQIMGRTSIADVESPVYPDDRLRWASVLASNQWTLDEMRDGTCWRMLKAG